jgi:hypothetical protein
VCALNFNAFCCADLVVELYDFRSVVVEVKRCWCGGVIEWKFVFLRLLQKRRESKMKKMPGLFINKHQARTENLKFLSLVAQIYFLGMKRARMKIQHTKKGRRRRQKFNNVQCWPELLLKIQQEKGAKKDQITFQSFLSLSAHTLSSYYHSNRASEQASGGSGPRRMERNREGF